MEAGDIVKATLPLATPFIAALIETWLKPKLTALAKERKTDNALFEHAAIGKLTEYLDRSFSKHSYINTIVFQNQQRLLKDLYIPLSVRCVRDRSVIKVDHYSQDLIPKHERVVLIDTAGMGKSTLSKYLFLSCIIENAGIPLLLQLRQFVAGQSVIDMIHADLNAVNEVLDRDFILALLRRGDFVVFLDGYDEIPFAIRDSVTKQIREFIDKAGENDFVITSRPDPALASFPDFQHFDVVPLTTEQAFDLIRKYDLLGRAQDQIASKLIPRIESLSSQAIGSFLSNPLLVSLLYRSYQYKPTIPIRKHIFYRQVYDSLFESHDLTKGDAYIRDKHSELDIDELHELLRHFGFSTSKIGQIEFTKDHILRLLAESISSCPSLECQPADVLADLLVTVPLFVEEGTSFRWGHKALQDYFAAQFVCTDTKGAQEAVLLQLAEADNYRKYANVIDLCYDIDYKTFRRTIILKLIDDFMRYHGERYRSIVGLDENEIERRKAASFGRYLAIVPEGYSGKVLNEFLQEWIREQTFSVMVYPTPGPGSMRPFLVGSNLNGALLDLLAEKGEAMIDFVARRTLSEKLPPVPKIVLVSDDVDSELNSPRLFAMMTNLFEAAHPYSLNHARCVATRREIHREIQNEGKGLLAGL